MKYIKFFLIIATVLLIAVFFVNCQKDTHEKERVVFGNVFNDKVDAVCRDMREKYNVYDYYISVSAHGPRNRHLTISYAFDPSYEGHTFVDEAVSSASGAPYLQAIDLGFTNMYFVSPNEKIEFYVDKKNHCWKVK